MEFTKRQINARKAKARKVLTMLAELMDGSYDPHDPGHDLWMILSALRGPDSSNERVKEFTTAKIRAAIGIKPHSYNTAGVSSCGEKPWCLAPSIYDALNDTKIIESWHFCDHYQMAVRSLINLGYLKKWNRT